MTFMRRKDSYPPRRTGFNSRLRYTIPSISGGIFLIMDEFVVYALYSRSSGKTYVGFTSDLINRFHSHYHYSTIRCTLRFTLFPYTTLFRSTTKHEAMVRERWLKSGVGREWLRA